MRTASVAIMAALGLTAGQAIWAQSAGAVDVTVAHGIPGVDVDIEVVVEGDEEDTAFCFGPVSYLQQADLAETLGVDDIPAGEYEVNLYTAAGGACTGDLALTTDVSLALGKPVVVIAHLDQNGGFQVSSFTSDDSAPPAGFARYTIYHTAQAPRVDFRLRDLDGNRVTNQASTTRIVNGGQTFPNQVEAGDYDLEVSISQNLSFNFQPPVATVPVTFEDGDSIAAFVVGPDGDVFDAIVVPEPENGDGGDGGAEDDS